MYAIGVDSHEGMQQLARITSAPQPLHPSPVSYRVCQSQSLVVVAGGRRSSVASVCKRREFPSVIVTCRTMPNPHSHRDSRLPRSKVDKKLKQGVIRNMSAFVTGCCRDVEIRGGWHSAGGWQWAAGTGGWQSAADAGGWQSAAGTGGWQWRAMGNDGGGWGSGSWSSWPGWGGRERW